MSDSRDTTIRLSTEAKARLELYKRPDESYEDVILRLTARDKWAGFGALADDDGKTRTGMRRLREEMREGMARDVDDREDNHRNDDRDNHRNDDRGGGNDARPR